MLTENSTCATCVFSDILVESGDPYIHRNVVGEETQRHHIDTVLICRCWPPLVGQHPQVAEDDWCGQYSSKGLKE